MKLVSKMMWPMVGAVIFTSCTKKESIANEYAGDSAVTMTQSPAADASAPKNKNIITDNIGKYPKDFDLLGNNLISERIKKMTGASYTQIAENFEVETPVVQENNIYKLTGCQKNNCPAYHTTVLYDANNDNLNVILDQNGTLKVFQEKQLVPLSETLKKL